MEGMVEQYGTKYQRERLRKQQEQRGESIMRERGWTAPYEEQAASAGRMAEQHEARAEKAAKLKVEIMANEEQEAQLVEAAMKTFFDAMVPRIKEAASKAYQEQIGLAIEKIRTAAQINELVNSSSG
jgi:hypothetical protein